MAGKFTLKTKPQPQSGNQMATPAEAAAAKGPVVTTGSGTGLVYNPTILGTGGTGIPTKTRIPTYTTETVQPDITSTRFVTNQVYQSLLGRNATDQEVQQYHQKFLEYAKTHPILTRESIYDTSGTTGLSPLTPIRDVTVQKNPLSEQDFVSNIIRQGPEAKAYNAATTYFDAMRSAMGQFRGGF
jgi:hypothetical protein